MIRDLFINLTTRLSPHLRALGYLDEAIAMRKRSRRNREAWKTHLDNTRRFVLASAEKCRSRGKVVVLGSGLLLDVPLPELAGMFQEVFLMDVVCLPEVGQQIRAYRNVMFLEHDATNIAERLYQNSLRGDTALPEPAPLAAAYNGAGFVVSLNILSQLWVVPRAFIGRHLPSVPLEQVEDWCSRIVEAHYSTLRSLSRDICIIGDYEFVKRDSRGAIISRSTTVYDLALPAPDASWTWNILPPGAEGVSKELIVGAWHFPRSSRT
jgi:hypothetical protein